MFVRSNASDSFSTNFLRPYAAAEPALQFLRPLSLKLTLTARNRRCSASYGKRRVSTQVLHQHRLSTPSSEWRDSDAPRAKNDIRMQPKQLSHIAKPRCKQSQAANPRLVLW